MAGVAGTAGPGAIVARSKPADAYRQAHQSGVDSVGRPPDFAAGGCRPAFAAKNRVVPPQSLHLELDEGSRHGCIAARAGSRRRADDFQRPEPRSIQRAAGLGHCRRVCAVPLAFNRHGAALKSKEFSSIRRAPAFRNAAGSLEACYGSSRRRPPRAVLRRLDGMCRLRGLAAIAAGNELAA